MSFTPNPPLEPIQPNAEIGIEPARELPQENPPWGLVDVILIAVFSLIATGLMTMVAFAIVHFIPKWKHFSVSQLAAEPLVLIPPQALAYLLTLGFMVLVVRRGTDTEFLRAVKWRWPENVWPFVVGGLVLSIAIQVGSSFLPIPKTLPIDEFFKTTRAAWILSTFGIFIAPFFEEMFFRGFFYPALFRRSGFFAALVLNSLLFAFTHEGQLAHAWAPLLVLFIVGIVLTVVRARTQSVACSFLVHSAYNAFLFGMIFFATNGFRHMEKLH